MLSQIVKFVQIPNTTAYQRKGTDISQIGQREAVKLEIEDFNFKSKSGFFYQLFVCMRWVGLFEPLFLIHFLTKILSFCNHWKGNRKSVLKILFPRHQCCNAAFYRYFQTMANNVLLHCSCQGVQNCALVLQCSCEEGSSSMQHCFSLDAALNRTVLHCSTAFLWP